MRSPRASITVQNDMYFHSWASGSTICGPWQSWKAHKELCLIANMLGGAFWSFISPSIFRYMRYMPTHAWLCALSHIHTFTTEHTHVPHPHAHQRAPMHAHLGARPFSLHRTWSWSSQCSALLNWAPPPSCSLWEISNTSSNRFTSDLPTLASRWWQSGAI